MSPSRIIPNSAEVLLEQLVDRYDEVFGLGSMSVSMYDTAWVACVSRHINQRTQYVFPKTIRYLIYAQNELGGWKPTAMAHSNDPDIVDELLSTLAGLHALCVFRDDPGQLKYTTNDIQSRIERAQARLETLFARWEPSRSERVGCELLVLALLDTLEQHAISIDFPLKEQLLLLRKKKLSKLNPDHLYGSTPSTLLHSLEAFFAVPGFQWDRIAQHKVFGSIMCSPAATAAYLMRKSTWDDESEAYLRLVIENGAGNGCGACPSAYPSSYFETAWTFSILLQSGALRNVMQSESVRACHIIVIDALKEGGGLAGFAPGLLPDLDDSARCLIVKSLLGEPESSTSMVERFTRSDGKPLLTYAGETNPSFTANCNALIAMLKSKPPVDVSAIKGVAEFLFEQWRLADGSPGDKWSVSPYYGMMLASQAVVTLLEAWRQRTLPSLDTDFAIEASLLLLQCLVRLLAQQSSDGSWGTHGPREETAYAVLALTYLSKSPLHGHLASEVQQSIDKARNFLNSTPYVVELLWIEKTLYGSHYISSAYVIAALAASEDPLDFADVQSDFEATLGLDLKVMSGVCRLLSSLPAQKKSPEWLAKASYLEGMLFLPELKRQSKQLFPRRSFTEDKYIDMIPVLWTFANNAEGCWGVFLSSQYLTDMMMLSVFNFQVDEYMEAAIGPQAVAKEGETRAALNLLFATPLAKQNWLNGNGNGIHDVEVAAIEHTSNGTDEDLFAPLEAYIHWITRHPRLSQRPDTVDDLRRELSAFLQAHVQQTLDSARLSSVSEAPSKSLLAWVRSTGADHTSCPFSFVFAMAIHPATNGTHKTPKGSILDTVAASDFVRSLASLCRLQNDIGSIARDRAEANLNSVDFGEVKKAGDEGKARQMLVGLAEYESRRMVSAFDELERSLGAERCGEMAPVRLFRTTTVAFGEMYMAKDLASWRLDT